MSCRAMGMGGELIVYGVGAGAVLYGFGPGQVIGAVAVPVCGGRALVNKIHEAWTRSKLEASQEPAEKELLEKSLKQLKENIDQDVNKTAIFGLGMIPAIGGIAALAYWIKS